MALDLKTLSGSNISQLALDLDIDEVEKDSFIDPAEAQRRSDVALAALRLKFKDDAEALEKFELDQKLFLLTTNNTKDTKGNSQEQKNPPPEKPKTFAWAEDFYLLLDRGWPWRVATYIAWAGSPKIGRWPKTQEELAKEVLGLTSDRQISEWRKNNPAIDEMIGIMQAMPLLSHRRDVLEALAVSASNPSSKGAQDRKTFLTITNDYVPHMKIEDERPRTNPMDYTDEELAEAKKRIDKKFGIGDQTESTSNSNEENNG